MKYFIQYKTFIIIWTYWQISNVLFCQLLNSILFDTLTSTLSNRKLSESGKLLSGVSINNLIDWIISIIGAMKRQQNYWFTRRTWHNTFQKKYNAHLWTLLHALWITMANRLCNKIGCIHCLAAAKAFSVYNSRATWDYDQTIKAKLGSA